ncbi:hypothetical protein ATCC90586_007456 [Pythium insidiosum]|nr:hypothetical protein ATCC90586_007456 [Pythium insidiosum]
MSGGGGGGGGGRRRVAQLSQDEWRQALEQQIEEKRRRSQQPPSATERDERSDVAPMAESHKPSSATASEVRSDGGPKCRRGHGGQRMSREEYLKSLEEQIAERKRMEEERRLKEAREDARHERKELVVTSQATEKPVAEERGPETECGAELSEEQGSAAVTTAAASSASTTVSPIDGAVIAQLMELCQDVKQQNEELRRQLQEQYSVLASLQPVGADKRHSVQLSADKKRSVRRASFSGSSEAKKATALPRLPPKSAKSP